MLATLPWLKTYGKPLIGGETSDWLRNFTGPEQTPASNGINISATSRGSASPFDRPVPDLSRADPKKLAALSMSGYTYSIPAGGYISNKEASNANSYSIKYGVSDPAANARAKAYYDYIGSLPTHAEGTPALQQFYQLYGGGGGQSSGASLNSRLGGSYPGPYLISTPKATSTPRYGGGIGW